MAILCAFPTLDAMQGRVIGTYDQGLPGPLFICIGAMHGNETAGLRALELILKMLEVELVTNPEFQFYGRLVALVGNLGALRVGKRYQDRDLNRIWTDLDESVVDRESVERRELEDAIDTEIRNTDEKVILLDLHTTTADGGIFTFADESAEGIHLGSKLGAPVILKMVDTLPGTCMAYFSNKYGESLTGLAFEGGQHEDPTSINRMIAAVVSCLRAIRSVGAQHVAHEHDRILEHYSKGLPEVATVMYRHGISEADGFKMKQGYSNFDPVKKGDVLAVDLRGEILAPRSGLLLMPHYQLQGSDGFFIIEILDQTAK